MFHFQSEFPENSSHEDQLQTKVNKSVVTTGLVTWYCNVHHADVIMILGSSASKRWKNWWKFPRHSWILLQHPDSWYYKHRFSFQLWQQISKPIEEEVAICWYFTVKALQCISIIFSKFQQSSACSTSTSALYIWFPKHVIIPADSKVWCNMTQALAC